MNNLRKILTCYIHRFYTYLTFVYLKLIAKFQGTQIQPKDHKSRVDDDIRFLAKIGSLLYSFSRGRIGKTLEQVESADHIVIHAPDSCKNCRLSLSDVKGVLSDETRQVFEVPEPKIEVTEHRIELKNCPCCGKVSKGSFAENVKAPVQYGEHVQALATYFKNQHFIPAERVCEIFEDVFGISLSPGTCSKIDKKLFLKLESFRVNLKAYLIASKVLHLILSLFLCLIITLKVV